MCWNRNSCQLVCPESCRGNCYDSKTCCHHDCVGGCAGPDKKSQENCTACRMFVEYHDGRKKCVNECAHNYFVVSKI